MTNHTLEKPNDWWRLHLPLVIPLKFSQNSCHTSKARLTFLHRERKHLKLRMNHAHTNQLRGASNGLRTHGSIAIASG